MGKKEKAPKTSGGMSGSGTFSLDQDAHTSALKKKDYGSGGDFEALPNGDYDCEIEDVEVTTSTTEKTAGSVMYKKIQLNVLEGEHAGRKLFASVVIAHKNTAGRLYNFLEAIGRDIDAIQTNEQGAAVIDLPERDEILGKKVIARVTGKRPYPKLTDSDIQAGAVQKYQNELTLLPGGAGGKKKAKKADKAERVR